MQHGSGNIRPFINPLEQVEKLGVRLVVSVGADSTYIVLQ